MPARLCGHPETRSPEHHRMPNKHGGWVLIAERAREESRGLKRGENRELGLGRQRKAIAEDSPFPLRSLPQSLVEAAEEADLNHEFNASLVVSPRGSGCWTGWLCPAPTAAGVPAVRGTEQQSPILRPCARLGHGFVSEAFSPPPEGLREGVE